MRMPLLLLLTLTLLIRPVPAAATVYLPADFGDMVAASSFIVHGRVVDVRSDAVADRRSIVTYVTIDVAQRLKGSGGDSITFLVPGGELGRYARVVVGAPRFERGDEVVLFLAARGPSIPYVFGLSQGVYRISRANGRALVLPPSVLTRDAGATGGDTARGDIALGNAGRIVRGDPARRPLPLDEFAQEVRAVMGRSR